MLDPAVDPRGNGCDDSTRGKRQLDGVEIVGLVGDEFACQDAVQESGQLRCLGGVAWPYRKSDKPSASSNTAMSLKEMDVCSIAPWQSLPRLSSS